MMWHFQSTFTYILDCITKLCPLYTSNNVFVGFTEGLALYLAFENSKKIISKAKI